MDTVPCETVREEDERVVVLELFGLQRVTLLEIGELHPLSLTQGFEVEIRIDGRSVGFAKIAGKGDAEEAGHDAFPPFSFFCFPAGAQPSRSLPTASASALCSTQTSPE